MDSAETEVLHQKYTYLKYQFRYQRIQVFSVVTVFQVTYLDQSLH